MQFDRPIGAAADVNELEYVSGLNKTSVPHIRIDGSITNEDIVSFLASQYGIRVTNEHVRQTILEGMGGGGGSSVDDNGDNDKDDCIERG